MRARIQSYQVALVAVCGVWVFPVVVPLVQVTVLADGIGVQALQGLLIGYDVVVAGFACSNNVL